MSQDFDEFGTAVFLSFVQPVDENYEKRYHKRNTSTHIEKVICPPAYYVRIYVPRSPKHIMGAHCSKHKAQHRHEHIESLDFPCGVSGGGICNSWHDFGK